MSDPSIEHVENLIRVIRNTPETKFNINEWYDEKTGCGCVIGHAIRDAYFIAQGFDPFCAHKKTIPQFLSISEDRASRLFSRHPGYETRQDVLEALQVLLLEKMAQPTMLSTQVYAEYSKVDIET